ncbi:MAG: acyl--CoA ligase [Candidatus Thorarchaeota archaeon]|nr:MAG: acyl--CoA ligase [Candidatus Thorarchaeota archaeon]
MLKAFSDLLANNARDYGENLAVVCGEVRLTWADLDKLVSRTSNSILERTPEGKGHRIGILMENRPEFLAVLYGAQRAGMVPAPINTRFVGREIRHVIEASRPSLIVCTAHFRSNLLEGISHLEQKPHVVILEETEEESKHGEMWSDFLDRASPTPPNVDVEPSDLGVQLFTGGTTGLPKASDFTHKALLDACTLIPDHGLQLIFDGQVPESALLPSDTELKFLVPTPLYHLSGFMPAIIMSAMKRPIAFPTSLSFEPEEICTLIEQEKITAVFMVPTQFRVFLDYPKLSEHDLSSVTLLSSGGSKMAAETKIEILERFPEAVLVDGYGQTENIGAAIYSFMTPADIPKIVDGYIGKPISGVEMRIIDDEGRDVKPGEVGEAVYRSPSLMRGYHGDSSTTEDAFVEDWFRTGDLFRVDEEGNYYYVDRKSEVIFSGSEKVFPAEVERIIASHPKIEAAVVLGEEDRTWGQIVIAIVAPVKGQSVSAEEVIEWCSGKMASFKKPKVVRIRESLPVAEDGKVLRSALKDELVSGDSG